MQYIKILLENKITQALLYLLSNTNCLDIKAICIKFLNLLIDSRFMNMSETQITNYILEKVWNYSTYNKDAIEYDSQDSNSRFRSQTRQLSLIRYTENPSVYSPQKENSSPINLAASQNVKFEKKEGGGLFNFNPDTNATKSLMSFDTELQSPALPLPAPQKVICTNVVITYHHI